MDGGGCVLCMLSACSRSPKSEYKGAAGCLPSQLFPCHFAETGPCHSILRGHQALLNPYKGSWRPVAHPGLLALVPAVLPASSWEGLVQDLNSEPVLPQREP